MKQYDKDKIWVPVEKSEVVPANSRTIDGQFYKPFSYVIVLTLEELREVFEAGRASGRDDLLIEQGTPVIGILVPDFTQYLKEQGITIP